MVLNLAKIDLGRSELKAFVKSDNFLKKPEEFEKLLSEYEKNLIELAT